MESLRGHAEARGVTVAALFRTQMGPLLGGEPSSVPVEDEIQPETKAAPLRAVRAPEVASDDGFLPDAKWVSNRTGGKLSYQAAAEALKAGRVEWLGGRIRVDGEVF